MGRNIVWTEWYDRSVCGEVWNDPLCKTVREETDCPGYGRSFQYEIFCDHGKTVFTSRMFIDHVSYVKVKNLSGKFYDLKK